MLIVDIGRYQQKIGINIDLASKISKGFFQVAFLKAIAWVRVRRFQ